MSFPFITAEQRLAEKRGSKGVILGPSGVGKTTLLKTADATRTLFIDLEAGDLAVLDWPGDSVRPRTWQECRDLACYIGGPNPALPGTASTSSASTIGSTARNAVYERSAPSTRRCRAASVPTCRSSGC